jgi:vacuolar-type H+-ATPase subunit C/Vma6
LEELQKVLLESLKIRAVKLEGVDILFEKKFFEDVRRGFRVDPVSFYSVMDYINDLERESATLRVIAYAKSFGLTPEQIREVLYV